jgi:Trk K+ transport system NAD-binding subunit
MGARRYMKILILSEMRTESIRERFTDCEVMVVRSWEEMTEKLASGEHFHTIILDGYDIALREQLGIRRTDAFARLFGGR